MAVHPISIFGPMQDAPARKTAGSVRLAPAVKNDVFLNALLEMPTTQQTRRSPLKWLSALGFHIVIVGALIIVPLHHGDNSPERISRNPSGCSTAALGTAPGARRRCGPSAYHAPKGKVELHAAKTDNAYRDSEERFLILRQRRRNSSRFGGRAGRCSGRRSWWSDWRRSW